MEVPANVKDKIRQELELHFLLSHYMVCQEVTKIALERAELEKNESIVAKIKNILDAKKQTETRYQTIVKLRDQIENDAKSAGFNDFSKEHLTASALDYTQNDPHYENRIMLAIKLIVVLPKDFSGTTKNQVFKEVSKLLGFPKSTTISDIESNLITSYRTLNVDKTVRFEDIVKTGAIASLITAGIAGVVIVPFLGLGGAMVATRILTATSLGLLVGASVAGIAYVLKDQFDRKNVIEEIYELSPDDLASVLAFNSTVINMMIKVGVDKQNEIIKKRLEVYVQLNNKINVDYYLGNQEKPMIKTKKSMINRCDSLLIKVV